MKQDKFWVVFASIVCLIALVCVLGCVPSWDSNPSALIGIAKLISRLFGG